jgi:hypothetical protein
VRRLSVDHQAGKLGRDAVLSDESGRRIFPLAGDWAVTNDDRRTVLFLAPDFTGIIKAGIVGGLFEGIIGGSGTASPAARGSGPGQQTVKRANPPIRGIPPRWTPVATVTRERSQPGVPTAYVVEMHEALPPVAFVQRFDTEALRTFDNGYGDRREGVVDLVHADGRPILRHWATIDAKYRLRTSTFDIEDDGFPLAEAVVLCLARHLAWRT